MDNWDDLRFLVAVAKSGSMTTAARLLGTNVATVSRRIDRLTQQLGAAPFLRTPEGWRPSPQVRGLLEEAFRFEGRIAAELNAQRRPRDDGLRVTVRLGAPPFVSSRVLLPSLSEQPQSLVGVALMLGDRIGGEGLGEFDVIVRFRAPESGRLRTKRVGSLVARFYMHVEAPVAVEWVGLIDTHDASTPMRIARERFGGPPSMRLPSFDAVGDAMVRTRRAGILPDIVARSHPALVAVDGPHAPPPWTAEFWVAYHESRRGDPAIDSTLDWIEAAFAAVT